MATPTATLGEVLVDSEAIRVRVAELAAEIDTHYGAAERPLVLLCVLKGALIFTADLVRQLRSAVEIDCIALSSYGARTQGPGKIALVKGVTTDLAGRDVLIVEDIVDTGHTVAFLQRHLAGLGARSVRLVSLLDKTSRRVREVPIDWGGFVIPDRFVVGYGLDHDERYRNLADVRVLDIG